MKFAVISLVLWAGMALAVDPGVLSVENLTQDLLRVESVREIKNIQRTYAQLAQHGRWKGMASLFAENGILRWGKGAGDILSTSDASSITGRPAIENWLQQEAGDMDGINPGSLHVFMSDMPVITLADDGNTAKGRWTALRKLGNGKGATRIEGGIFENEYVSSGGKWKISLLRYYPLYAGTYEKGWKNLGLNGSLPVISYHYTLDQAGVTLLHAGRTASRSKEGTGTLNRRSTPAASLSVDELEYRVAHLNEEDEVRNLVHGMGYYVDRRMWPDVISLFTSNGTITVQNNTSPAGPAGIQSVLNRMGPEGLSHGILNEHPIFGTVVNVSPDHKTAVARGLEIGLIGDDNAQTGQWQFCVFHHSLVKDLDTGTWKIQDLGYHRLLFADYAAGWGDGGILPASSLDPPPVLPPYYQSTENRRPVEWRPFYKRYPAWEEPEEEMRDRLANIHRLLLRSSAYDESENTSGSYGFYIDDIRCSDFAKLHSDRGHKLSPGIGWYYTPDAISLSCASRYYRQNSTTYNPSMSSLRSSVPFHWRLQPVILVSHDGRSATLRTRNLQTGTSRTQGSNGWMGGMYHDQLVLENGKRKLWSITIDEFYWNSRNWTAGWANVVPHVSNATTPRRWMSRRQSNDLPPDVSLRHPALLERETGFNGGPPPTVSWPGVQRMWWAYRNLVTGAMPSDSSYWGPPGCVPCRGAKPEWALTANGYQEPPSGPTIVTADWLEGSGVDIEVTVKGGPEESAKGGWVQLVLDFNGEITKFGEEGPVGEDGKVVLRVRGPGAFGTTVPIQVFYFGNENLKPGKGIMRDRK
ncbi:hypothetical protein QC763_101160 [Podospora pseudopauciseta]|uniref:SnoaL-like domain-containing protein n=1 Tax=Podospora pseudopauciseta TaxID=2093780 RepID=A0ABR0HWD3_9PEZI|nr:hypothetical protein QC763_101160 [Podospora pseudopauciseta]